MIDEYNPDDEYVEDEYDDGYILMNEDELYKWLVDSWEYVMNDDAYEL